MIPLIGDAAERHARTTPCARRVTEIILHHTWRPTAAQYRGRTTAEGIRRYHVQTNGWSDIGYHYLVAPDGTVWVGRALGRTGAHVANRNVGTVGVAMILDGDTEEPSAAQAGATGRLLAALFERFGLSPLDRLGFHRDYSTKTCPGTRITKAMVRGWLVAAAQPAPPPAPPAAPPARALVLPDGRRVPYVLVGERAAVLVTDLADAMGWSVDASGWPEVRVRERTVGAG